MNRDELLRLIEDLWAYAEIDLQTDREGNRWQELSSRVQKARDLFEPEPCAAHGNPNCDICSDGPTDEQYRKAARNEYERDGEIEIDENASVSRGADPGAYVQAWVWVGDDEAIEGPDPCQCYRCTGKTPRRT